MKRTPRILLLTALLALACGGDDGGPTDPNPNPNPNPLPEFGHIQVSTTTAGADLDPDGYTVKMDGAPDRSIGLNGVTTFSDVAVGSHQVELTGIADNCSANGTSPATAAVTKDATAQVSFDVDCEAFPIGSLTVTTTVTNNFDPDGFQVLVDGMSRGAVDVNGSATFDDLPAGPQQVELTGIAPNCTVDGDNPKAVTIPTGGNVTAEFPVTCSSPPDGRIVYTGSVDGRFGVAVMNTDGSGQMLIWQYPPSGPGTGGWHAAWSPDGEEIVFGSDHEGPQSLYVIKKDGSGLRRLTESVHSDGNPAWSPNGSRILFERREQGTEISALFVINSDGTGVGPFPHAAPADFETLPDWSPDGTKIAFYAQAEDRRDLAGIFVMNSDGSNVVQITDPVAICAADGWPMWADIEPQWSPDGSRILFTRSHECEPDDSEFGYDLLLMNPDGTDPVNITHWPEWQTHPRWSPDGSKIVYDGGDWTIHVINADGSGHVAIIPGGNVPAYGPDWGP